MQIQPARADAMARIKELYDEAIAFQRSNGHPHWQDVNLDVVAADIARGCQHTLMVERQIAGIFSLCPPSVMDHDLWQGWQPTSARYLNRIIVGREWRGQHLFAHMLAWCEQALARQAIGVLRLDTWAANLSLTAYYATFGFTFVAERTTSTSLTLPPQYRGVRLALMEKPISLVARLSD